MNDVKPKACRPEVDQSLRAVSLHSWKKKRCRVRILIFFPTSTRPVTVTTTGAFSGPHAGVATG